MPKTRAQKENTVQVLADKLSASKSVVFADYKGMTMTQLSELRNTLRDQDAQFLVTKNSLLKLALKQVNKQELPAEVLEGPVATLFAQGDEIVPIKSLVKSLKDAQIGKIKAGFVGEDLFDQYEITRLANLPSKQELQAKVVGSLASPLYGIVNVLQANIRNLVYALDQIRISKGGEA